MYKRFCVFREEASTLEKSSVWQVVASLDDQPQFGLEFKTIRGAIPESQGMYENVGATSTALINL